MEWPGAVNSGLGGNSYPAFMLAFFYVTAAVLEAGLRFPNGEDAMATRTIIELTDDLDESPADETVTFGLDGAELEIDLSGANAEKLRTTLQPYIQAARRRGAGRRRRATGGAKVTGAPRDREQVRAIRKWAKEKGYQVSERGRIPAEVERAYNQAH